MNAKASSPSSTGPAGPEFEVSVGAFYNLSMLAGAAPLGLPGTTIESVVLQRAAEGHPLDDVIVKAKTSDGSPATLEIQAKRSLDFTPKDEEWRKVVAQIVQVSCKPEFKAEYYEMAIAIAQTSKKISGSYQAVLRQARELEDAHTFFERFTPSGSANKDMCTFVSTFKAHVVEAGGPGDNETIWQLLRRLQILVFDFGVSGSSFEHLAVERAASILHHGQKQQARVLWDALISLTLHAAANGGGCTRSKLIMELTQRSFRFSGHPNYTFAQNVVSNDSDCALANIKDQIGAFTLTRHGHLAAIRDALDTGRYIEICGEPGVGKSGLLKHYAMQVGEACALVLSPNCVIEGGWTGMQIALKIEGTAEEFLSDLASQGRNIVFLDNLNFFNERGRKTVIDLIRAAATIQSISVISTARRDFGNEELSWLPPKALESLGHVVLPIGALNKTEVEELQRALPSLSPLLANMHPAREAQTLFRLAYLVKRPKEARVFFSEAEMAHEWWETVDGMSKEQRRESQRVLKVIIKQALIHLGSINVSECPASTVDLLIKRGILRDLGNDRVVFDEDVFCEWGIANFLRIDPEAISLLCFERPARSDLARAIEILSRMYLEISSDFSQWKLLFNRVSQEKVHDTWRRAALLGLVRSEMADKLFQNQDVADFLLADDEKVMQELMGVLISIETRPAIEVLPAVGIPKEKIPQNLHSPIGPAWERIITWLLTINRMLSEKTAISVMRLYIFWCEGTLGKGPHVSSVLRSLYQWLIEIEMACRYESSAECPEPFGRKLDFHDRKKLASELRMTFLAFCDQVPNLAVEYLQTLKKQRRGDEAVVSVLTFRGMLATAAPRELEELTLNALIQEKDPDSIYDADPLAEPFALEWFFTSPSPARGPFLELLVYAPLHGLNLVRQLVAHAASFLADNYSRTDGIMLNFLEGPREFSCVESYGWSRGSGYATVASALMALEAWGHKRIEAGENIDDVLSDVLGPLGSPAAYLLVAVDLLISHWPKSSEAAIPFTACLKLLILDDRRFDWDRTSIKPAGLDFLRPEPQGIVRLADLKNRPSRGQPLINLIGLYTTVKLPNLRERLERMLQSPVKDDDFIEQWEKENLEAVAVKALNRIDPVNWENISYVGPDNVKATGYKYVAPLEERQLLEALQKARLEAHVQSSLENKGNAHSKGIRGFLEAAVSDGLIGIEGVVLKAVTSCEGTPQLRSLLRCVFSACIYPIRDRSCIEEEVALRLEQRRQSLLLRVEAEMDWLVEGKVSEPEWPLFPLEDQTKTCVSHQAVASWLDSLRNYVNITEHTWLLDVIRFYAPWTVEANSIESKERSEGTYLGSWNRAYFGLLGWYFPELSSKEVEDLILGPLSEFSEEQLFDAVTPLLTNIDEMYFHREKSEASVVVAVRGKLTDQVMKTAAWKRVGRGQSHTIETRIRPVICSLLFNGSLLSQPPICYLHPEAMNKIDGMLPALEKLVLSGPSLFVAVLTLNLFETSPKPEHLAFIVRAAQVWLKKFPDDGFFWVDHEIGRRLCLWLEKALVKGLMKLQLNQELQDDLTELFTALIKLGVPEAGLLEKKFLF